MPEILYLIEANRAERIRDQNVLPRSQACVTDDHYIDRLDLFLHASLQDLHGGIRKKLV